MVEKPGGFMRKQQLAAHALLVALTGFEPCMLLQETFDSMRR